MLLDPVPASADEAHDASPASEPGRRRRPRKPALTPAEARGADARTAAILEANGIDFRPAQVTSLLVLSTGVEHALPNLRERSFFAYHHRHRVAEMALTFDAFRQGRDLGNLRLVGLRPVEGKAPLGGLAVAFAAFSGAYNTHVGRLVTARTIEPVLTVIHVRFDVALCAWDLHAHALWNVPDANIDAMWIGLGTHFSDKWMDGERVERPGAAANYCLSWTIDHREIMQWPEEAVLELWNLERPRLMRPAGAFLACRRDLKTKILSRDGDIVRIEDRPVTGPRRKAARRPGPPVEGARVVSITDARVGGKRERCAVLKRSRADVQQSKATAQEAGPSHLSRVRDTLAYGEYRPNSPTAGSGLLPPSSATASPPTASSPAQDHRPVRKADSAALRTIVPRKAWMLRTWPPRPFGRLPRPVARRLAQSTFEAPKPLAGSSSSGEPTASRAPESPSLSRWWVAQAARTVLRKRATSAERCSDWRESSEAEART